MIRRPPRSTLFPYRRSSDPRAMIPRLEHLIQFARATRIPIVWTQSDHRPPYGGLMLRKFPPIAEDHILWQGEPDRKSTRLNSSHSQISYAVFCLKKKIRYENAQNDKSVHGVLNLTYQAGVRRDSGQPDIEAERKIRDECDAGKSYCSRLFGGANC